MEERTPAEEPTGLPAPDLAESDELVSDQEPSPLTSGLGSGHDSGWGGRIPWPSIRVSPAGVVLLLALLGIAVYLVASGWLGDTSSGDQATPVQPTAVSTSIPSTAPATRIVAPTIAVPSPAELSEQLAQAWDLTLESEFEEAILLYQDLVQRAPDDALPEVGWAWALILDGKADLALEHARRAVELDPINAETMAVLARAHVELGDRERAVGMAEGAVQLDGGSARAHAILAAAYFLDGRPEDAVGEADVALAQDANEAEAHRIRGWLYREVDNDATGAAAEFQAAADLQPKLWLRQYELGLALIQAQEYGKAMAALRRASGLRRKAAVSTALGEVYYHLQEYDQAQIHLQEALSAGARDADTYALLAATAAQSGHCDEGTTYLRLALGQDPGHPLALAVQSSCQGVGPTPVPTPPPPPPTLPPTVSPLTGWIAFPVWNAGEVHYDTYIARADGSERHLLVEDMHQPAFAPDGLWLAVNGERQNQMNLFIVRPDGSGLREITQHLEDSLPCWSPDSRGLVFSSTQHGDKQSRLYVIDQVPLEGEKAQGRVLNSDLYEVLGEYPAWTDDGRIVYTGCDYAVTPNLCGLFLMSAAPGLQTPTRLTTDASDTAPAPHDRQIAFMSHRDGNWEIYLVNDDGSGLKRLTNSPANEGLPTWAPDGKTLAFVSDQGGVWAVWAMSPDGSERRKLFDLGGGGLTVDWQRERISWGP